MLRQQSVRCASIFLLGCIVIPTHLSAQTLEQRSRHGDWSVYCLATAKELTRDDCSLVAATVDKSQPTNWIRLAFSIISPVGDMELILKTPRLKYVGTGISIAADGKQIGRAFIKTCDDKSCRAIVNVDSRMLIGLSTATLATLQYQTGEASGVALPVRMDQFIDGVSDLRRAIGMKAEAIADRGRSSTSGSLARLYGLSGIDLKTQEFVVEMRSNPFLTLDFATTSWVDQNDLMGQQLTDCYGKPAKRVVVVSADLKLKNAKEVKAWITDAQACADRPVFWIKPKYTSFYQSDVGNRIQAVSKSAVFNAIKSEVAHVVLTDSSGLVPIRTPK